MPNLEIQGNTKIMYPNDIESLTRQYPNSGELLWIGLRPSRKQAVMPVETIHADPERGLIGDHYAGRSKKRQVTMM